MREKEPLNGVLTEAQLTALEVVKEQHRKDADQGKSEYFPLPDPLPETNVHPLTKSLGRWKNLVLTTTTILGAVSVGFLTYSIMRDSYTSDVIWRNALPMAGFGFALGMGAGHLLISCISMFEKAKN
ncbi:hypothetical protein HYT18_04720 [Candidatus Microgenomates bacterium]|nr:hypothetical protein [Candidatus Microgenomates bacterium]